MRVKRYTANTLQDAMQKVKMDMGRDAVILHTKKYKEGGFLGFFGKLVFEVTAAIEDSEPIPKPIVRPMAETAAAVNPQPMSNRVREVTKHDHLENDIREMKSLISEMMSQIDLNQDVKGLPRQFQKYFQILTTNDVEDNLTKKLLQEILKQVPDPDAVDGERVRQSLEEQILKLLKRAKPVAFKKQDQNRQSIALVGPTGVGKTTTLAKLAATFAIVDKKKVALITADTYRVAAVEQLKTYGEIIGIPVDVVYTPQELSSAVSRHADKDLVLIDTAGRSHKNSDQMNDLQRFIEAVEASDVFLVLSATTNYQDMMDIVNSYSDIPVTRIVFTKLDETSSFGSILNVIHNTQKSLSYVTMGQNVPDDIEVADPVKIAQSITKER